MTTSYSRRDAMALAPKSLLFGAGIAAGGLGSLVLPGTAMALGVPSYSSVAFDIIGSGERIGEFTGRFSGSQGGTFTATTSVRITSDLYSVDATNGETWTNGVLTALTGQGDDNGTPFSYTLSGSDGGLSGTTAGGDSVQTRAGSLPTTYWNRDFRTVNRVINTLNAEEFNVTSSELGSGTIATASGDVDVNKVRIRGRGLGLYNVVLSYDAAGDWTGLEFSLFGFDVLYRRRA